MSIQAVLSPLFLQVTLTFALLFWMGFLRTRAFSTGETRERDIALREPNWPKRATQVANAFHNQLELPVFFYVLTVLEGATGQADFVFVVLAWAFAILRLIHAAIHVSTNKVRHRGAVFGLGAVVLILMWALFMERVLFGSL